MNRSARRVLQIVLGKCQVEAAVLAAVLIFFETYHYHRPASSVSLGGPQPL